METKLIEISPYLFILYIIIKELLPAVRHLIEWMVPDSLKRRKTSDEKKQEMEEKDLDIREREVVAMEGIAKALVIIENNQKHFQGDFFDMKIALDKIDIGVVTANQALGVLMDRNMRLRTTDK